MTPRLDRLLLLSSLAFLLPLPGGHRRPDPVEFDDRDGVLPACRPGFAGPADAFRLGPDQLGVAGAVDGKPLVGVAALAGPFGPRMDGRGLGGGDGAHAASRLSRPHSTRRR